MLLDPLGEQILIINSKRVRSIGEKKKGGMPDTFVVMIDNTSCATLYKSYKWAKKKKKPRRIYTISEQSILMTIKSGRKP